MTRLRLAVCQQHAAPALDFDAWASSIAKYVEEAASQGAELVVFPEYTTLDLLAADPEHRAARPEDMGQLFRRVLAPLTPEYERLLATLSQRQRVWICGGSHWCPGPKAGAFYNTAFLFGPEGERFRQPKLHLTPGDLGAGTSPGDDVQTFPTPWGRVGMMVCYDAEFPEVARRLRDLGADLLLCPSFTLNERGFWRVRLSCAARALECQVYVAMSPRVGQLPFPQPRPLSAWGRAVVFGPPDNRTRLRDGVVAEGQPNQRQVLVVDLNLELLRESRARSEAPIARARRPDLYFKWLQPAQGGPQRV